MKPTRSRRALTPAFLCVLAFPIGFLLMPDGVPFVDAACFPNGTPVYASSVISMQAVTVTSCAYADLSTAIKIWSYTLDNTLAYCKFKSVVTVSVLAPTPGSGNAQCNLLTQQSCAGVPCTFWTTDNIGPFGGPYSGTAITLVNECNAHADDQRIWFQPSNGCGCSPFVHFDITAKSNNC